jgi:hypothetical protein
MQELLTTLAMLAISIPAMAEDQFSLGAGFDYSSGKYGDAASTSILYVPVTGKYASGALTLELTVPYLSVTGPGGVVQGLGRVGPANRRNNTTTESGLGDVIASAGYRVYDDDSLALDLAGKVKFGTANANRGLGTGKNDYAAQIDGYYVLEQATLMATAGYRIYGSPAGVTLHNAPYGTIGASHGFSNATSAGIMLNAAQSPGDAIAEKRDITVFVSHGMVGGTAVRATFLKGYTSGSPDYGFGVMITGYF